MNPKVAFPAKTPCVYFSDCLIWGALQLLASFYPGTLYPLNAPYLFLPVDQAMWVTTVVHVLLAGWLVALYARRAHGAVRIDTPWPAAALSFLPLAASSGSFWRRLN